MPATGRTSDRARHNAVSMPLGVPTATPSRNRSRPITAAVVAGALALLLFAAVAATGGALAKRAGRGARSAAGGVRGHTAAAPPAGPLTVSFTTAGAGPPVATRFLGLSFEAQSIPDLARFASEGDLPLLLRSLGPSVLRLGGVTADSSVAFADPPGAVPDWAHTTISAADLDGLATLAREGDARLLLTVGLAHDDPQAAASEAAAAQHVLGSSLLALEIGNEPDAYGRHGLRPAPWTFAQYAPEIAAYRSAIAAAAPGLALAGPDTTGASFAVWGPPEARAVRPALLTAHRYPLVCSSVPAPSIDALLSVATRTRELAQLRSDVAIARAGHIPLRIDETNSVSCGGRAGVSDTFASALWAVQLITEAMQLGIAGINFHDLPANCAGYSSLCASDPAALAAGRLVAAPEWYALLLTRGLTGERPLATVVRPAVPDVAAAAFGGRGAARVILVDSDAGGGERAVRLLVGGAYARASVVSLTAPSLSATTGVRLGGRSVNALGELLGPLRHTVARRAHGSITVTLAPASAALVTLSGR